MKEIQLTQGKVALVDDEDYEWLSQWEWHADHNRGLWYARRNGNYSGKRVGIKMHRVIMNPEKPLEVDHIDGNGLNNQRKNLRICTKVQNSRNKKKRSNSKCGRIGVSLSGRFYRSYIWVDGDQKYLGTFWNEDDAARAYDKAAKTHFGEYARLNFP